MRVWWDDIKPAKAINKASIDIAKKLVSKKLFVDPLAAQTYLWKIIGEKEEEFEFSDFLLIFLKGIVKDVICGIAKTVEMANSDGDNEKELLW